MEDLSRDVENLRDLAQSGGWLVMREIIVAETARTMGDLLLAEEGTDSARLKARVSALDWVLKLPQAKIAEYDANEVRAREDDPPADDPQERLSPIPEG